MRWRVVDLKRFRACDTHMLCWECVINEDKMFWSNKFSEWHLVLWWYETLYNGDILYEAGWI